MKLGFGLQMDNSVSKTELRQSGYRPEALNNMAEKEPAEFTASDVR